MFKSLIIFHVHLRHFLAVCAIPDKYTEAVETGYGWSVLVWWTRTLLEPAQTLFSFDSHFDSRGFTLYEFCTSTQILTWVDVGRFQKNNSPLIGSPLLPLRHLGAG